MITLVHDFTERVYLRKWPPGVSSGCPVWRQCPQRVFGLKPPDSEGGQVAKCLALSIEYAQEVWAADMYARGRDLCVCVCESGCEIVDRQGGMPMYACMYINVGGRHVCQRAGFVCGCVCAKMSATSWTDKGERPKRADQSIA